MRGASRQLTGDQTWSGCPSAASDPHRRAIAELGRHDRGDKNGKGRHFGTLHVRKGKVGDVQRDREPDARQRADSEHHPPRHPLWGVPPAATSPPQGTPSASRTPVRKTLLIRVRRRQRPRADPRISECGPRRQIEAGPRTKPKGLASALDAQQVRRRDFRDVRKSLS
jgi:hypothetical protein